MTIAQTRTSFASGDGTCAASLFRGASETFEAPRGRPVVVTGLGFGATRPRAQPGARRSAAT